MKRFLRAGHTPTLVAALLYFDVSFMAWVLLGPLAPFLRAELGLNATEQGLVTAIPLLGGSLFRPLLGVLGEHIGGRRTGLLGLVLTLMTLAAGWQFAHTTVHFYVLGFFLGIAGASFAVALPLASRWYPPEYQGLAMGIAGAGNSGTLLATLFAPRLAEQFGWQATFGIAIAPIAVVLGLFVLLARDSPRRSTPATLSDYAAVVRERDSPGLYGCAAAFLAGTIVLLELGIRWSQRWDVSAVQRAGVYSYRTAVLGLDDDRVRN
jgi:NNP family nitrate/nitrite transporter-like MFS transporter